MSPHSIHDDITTTLPSDSHLLTSEYEDNKNFNVIQNVPTNVKRKRSLSEPHGAISITKESTSIHAHEPMVIYIN